MTKIDNSLALLPNGFVDLLPPFAQIEADSINILMDKFASFGYQRVKPPFMEYAQSLLGTGPGAYLSSDTFRLMDPVTNKMLGLRCDSTAQISRIVSSRLVDEPRPLRLAYANNVLRTHGSQMRTERQFTQVGCEFVGGGDCIESDVEICVLPIIGLKSLGVRDITMDLTIPNFVSRMLSGDNTLNDAVVEDIKKAVSMRDSDMLLSMDCSKAHMIARIINSTGDYSKALEVLLMLDVDNDIRKDILSLSKVCSKIEAVLQDLGIDDVSLSIDAVEQGKFEYHKNLGFTLFSEHSRGELGSGGCYDVRFGEENRAEVAKGFTLYMDTLLQVLGDKVISKSVNRRKIFVKSNQPWDVISKLQDHGWVVVRGVKGEKKPPSCTHIYENEEIIEL